MDIDEYKASEMLFRIQSYYFFIVNVQYMVKDDVCKGH